MPLINGTVDVVGRVRIVELFFWFLWVTAAGADTLVSDCREGFLKRTKMIFINRLFLAGFIITLSLPLAA